MQIAETITTIKTPNHRVLNRVLFGAGIARFEDYNSQLEVVAAAYIANLAIIFVPVAMIFAAMGLYDPFHSPLATSNIQMPLAVSNALTFFLTYLASLNWKANEQAIERWRNARRPIGGFYKLLSLIFIPSIVVCGLFSFFLLAALFRVFGFAIFLGSIVANSVFLHVLFSLRNLRRENRE